MADSLLLDVRAVARLLGLGERTIWRMAGSGEMPAPLRFGRRRLWHRPTLERWLAHRASEGGPTS
ncbi:MAG: helix-turn-helix transcriptional regulator [Planctomycetota bacterium]|jgi:excisionase family DNA binding protein